MFNTYPDILTVKQVSEALQIGRNKAYELINNGTIQCKRIGRKIIVPKLFLIDYVKSTRYNIST